MHPYLIQSFAAQRTRELRELAQARHDAVLAAGRHQRQRRLPRPRGAARLPRIRRVLGWV